MVLNQTWKTRKILIFIREWLAKKIIKFLTLQTKNSQLVFFKVGTLSNNLTKKSKWKHSHQNKYKIPKTSILSKRKSILLKSSNFSRVSLISMIALLLISTQKALKHTSSRKSKELFGISTPLQEQSRFHVFPKDILKLIERLIKTPSKEFFQTLKTKQKFKTSH